MAAMSFRIFSKDTKYSHIHRLFLRCFDTDHVKQVHAHIHKLGLALKPTQYSINLLNLYITLSRDYDWGLTQASMLFARIKNPDVFMYNTMIRAYSCSSTTPRKAILLYNRMVIDQIQCNGYTLPYVLKTCRGVEEIEQVHTHVLKTEYGSEVHSVNALIHAYAGLGDVDSTRRVFGSTVEKDVVSGNLMMNCLMKCGRLEEALSILKSMLEKNVVSWTKMIKGCVELGLSDEALELFQEMIDSGVRPDKVAVTAAVAACGVSGSLVQGEWIHLYIVRNKINVDSALSCILIDMYAKCGALDKANEIFNALDNEKNVTRWTVLISGFGAHGQAWEAIEWFYRMKEAGVMPNSITFTSILTACSHAGVVNKGKSLFKSMELWVHGGSDGSSWTTRTGNGLHQKHVYKTSCSHLKSNDQGLLRA